MHGLSVLQSYHHFMADTPNDESHFAHSRLRGLQTEVLKNVTSIRGPLYTLQLAIKSIINIKDVIILHLT